MPSIRGEDGAKAYKIFEVIENKFAINDLLWSNFISLSVDNCSTMIGVRNSVALHFLNKSPNVYIYGCPCHLARQAMSMMLPATLLVLTLKRFASILFTGSIIARRGMEISRISGISECFETYIYPLAISRKMHMLSSSKTSV